MWTPQAVKELLKLLTVLVREAAAVADACWGWF